MLRVVIPTPLSLSARTHARTHKMRASLFTLGVSVLATTQQQLSQRFAESRDDRFSGVPTRRGDSGVALIEGALAQLETRIVAQHPGGDHTIVVCEVIGGTVEPGDPLLYHRAAYARLSV